jgi:hypothetical protein
MARKYSRDNRGRFAGAGGGATARGGRLKTAAGNKRETQKRIMFSPESKRLSGVSLDAAAKSGKINMPVRFGGEGAGYKTPRGKAAAAAATAANNAKRAEIRRAGLPKSGGAMRVKGGIKRDPGAAAKLASRAKPARAAAKPKTGQEVMKTNVRKVQNEKLRKINAQIKEAGPNAAGLRLQKLQLQSNMTSTRPKRTPKQEAKEQASVAAAKKRVAQMKRVSRATANRERTADTRNKPGSTMLRRPSKKTTRSNLLAERALSFYSNPAKALQAVKKSRRGFRLPRGMR